MINFSQEEEGLRLYSPTGVPLINLCIQNETSSPKWHLNTLLRILLEEGNYDDFDQRYGNLLIFTVKDNCFESLDIELEGGYNFDV